MRAYGNVNRMAIISKENGETIRDYKIPVKIRPHNDKKNNNNNKIPAGLPLPQEGYTSLTPCLPSVVSWCSVSG